MSLHHPIQNRFIRIPSNLFKFIHLFACIAQVLMAIKRLPSRFTLGFLALSCTVLKLFLKEQDLNDLPPSGRHFKFKISPLKIRPNRSKPCLVREKCHAAADLRNASRGSAVRLPFWRPIGVSGWIVCWNQVSNWGFAKIDPLWSLYNRLALEELVTATVAALEAVVRLVGYVSTWKPVQGQTATWLQIVQYVADSWDTV